MIARHEGLFPSDISTSQVPVNLDEAAYCTTANQTSQDNTQRANKGKGIGCQINLAQPNNRLTLQHCSITYIEAKISGWVQDVIERLWGLKFHGYFSTQTDAASLYDVQNQNTADFIPRTRACMLSSDSGLVIAFRGSEPLNLINLRSSGKSVHHTLRSRKPTIQ